MYLTYIFKTKFLFMGSLNNVLMIFVNKTFKIICIINIYVHIFVCHFTPINTKQSLATYHIPTTTLITY